MALRLAGVWLALILLLAVSVGATFLPALGPWRQAISLAVAAAKATLILWIFMDLRAADGLTRVVALGALTFLAILFTLFSADYLTRGWLSA